MITVTEKAASAIKDFLSKEGKEGFGLRVAAQAGCCGGPSYGLFVEKEANVDDLVVMMGGVKIFVDETSRPLLEGATLDYVQGTEGEGFYINSPQQAREQGGGSCGCGSSGAGSGQGSAEGEGNGSCGCGCKH